MKKTNYVRPLAEVIDLEVCDIITASGEFSTELEGAQKSIALDNLDAYVNYGKIVLQ